MPRAQAPGDPHLPGAAHPDTINTVRTYCYGTGDEAGVWPAKGKTDLEALASMLNEEVASSTSSSPTSRPV